MRTFGSSRIAGTVLLLVFTVLCAGAEGGTESRLSATVAFTDSSGASVPKIITWSNPETYEDGTAISAASRSRIETRLYYSLDLARWTRFATVTGGKESWEGTIPVGTAIPAYYAATSTIGDGAVADSEDRFDVSVAAYQDTYVASGDRSDTNYSTEPRIRTSLGSDHKAESRGLLLWDLTSLPFDARVSGAVLRLHSLGEMDAAADDACTVSVAMVAGANPDPGLATWNSPDSLNGWSGGPDGGTNDLAPAESAASVGPAEGRVVWNVTNMVRRWVEAPWSNRGMAIDPGETSVDGCDRFFASREHPDPLLRPELVIEYRRPEDAPPEEGTPLPVISADAGTEVDADLFTVEVGRYEDTFVNLGGFADINYSADPLIRTYTWPENNSANRGLIRWDLSGLPGGVAVTNATLWLYYADDDNGGVSEEYTVWVSKVTGVFPDIGAATWNSFDGVSPWPGGNNGGAEAMGSGGASATIGRTFRWASWDVTDMVREWIGDPGTNSGMIIDSDPTAAKDSNRYFASREYPDPRLRPRLLITYTKIR